MVANLRSRGPNVTCREAPSPQTVCRQFLRQRLCRCDVRCVAVCIVLQRQSPSGIIWTKIWQFGVYFSKRTVKSLWHCFPIAEGNCSIAWSIWHWLTSNHYLTSIQPIGLECRPTDGQYVPCDEASKVSFEQTLKLKGIRKTQCMKGECYYIFCEV